MTDAKVSRGGNTLEFHQRGFSEFNKIESSRRVWADKQPYNIYQQVKGSILMYLNWNSVESTNKRVNLEIE